MSYESVYRPLLRYVCAYIGPRFAREVQSVSGASSITVIQALTITAEKKRKVDRIPVKKKINK
jgi:hypothetical protein